MPSACTPVSVRLELWSRGAEANSLLRASSIFCCTPTPVFCTCQPAYRVPSNARISLILTLSTPGDFRGKAAEGQRVSGRKADQTSHSILPAVVWSDLKFGQNALRFRYSSKATATAWFRAVALG